LKAITYILLLVSYPKPKTLRTDPKSPLSVLLRLKALLVFASTDMLHNSSASH
jgi:hypothetical protein